MTLAQTMPSQFNGSLEGFDKEMKTLVLQTIDNGWSGRLSANGHAILNHSSGLTVAVSRSAKNLISAKAAIRRVENQTPPSEEWLYTGETKRVLFNGSIYKCAICDQTFSTVQKATGHFVGNHVDRIKSKEIAQKRKEEKVAKESRVIEVETQEILPATEEPEKWIQEPIPGLEIVPAQPIEELAEWLRSVPMASIEALLETVEDNRRLKEENKKLRETLSALIALAKEI